MANTTPKASNVYTQAADFLAALFRNAPDEQLLELRIIVPGGSVRQQYHQIGELKASGFGAAIPTHYDGQANLYYSVATRIRREGTADAVGTASAIWFDEWTQPADLPPMSWILETSPGKSQGGYFLKETTTDLARVERLNKRLAQAVGGDKVFDRARVLRLPGFLNVKPEHPEHPRAQLLELNPDLRYTLEELEAALPELAEHATEPVQREHSGPFDPHAGTPLAQADQDRLAKFLKDDLGLRRNFDGRYGGACPLPHQDGASTSESNFYCSPITGRWKCFGSLHIGNDTGGIDALKLIGFDLALPDDTWLRKLTKAFGSDWLGVDEPEPFKRREDTPDTNVRLRVKVKNPLYPKSDKRRKKKGETLWQEALEHFPILRGVKPVGLSRMAVDTHAQEIRVWDKYSKTWRNPANANQNRRQRYLGLVPILNGSGPWFGLDIRLEDVGSEEECTHRHEALLKAVKRKREGGQCFSIDNLLAKGVLAYIANVPLKGFESIDDPVAWLVSSLKAIRPPRHDEDQDQPFRPIKGTYRIKVAAEKPVDENQNRLKLIATSAKATDFLLVEATAQTVGLSAEYASDPLFRSQCSDYSLKIPYNNIDQVLALVDGLENYELTKFAREELAESLEIVATP